MYTMSTASATGVTFGGILIAVTLGSLGYIAWKKRRFLGHRPTAPEAIEIEDMSQQRSSSPQPGRSVPMVIVQSPSDPGEPGSSPLMTRSQSSE
ncbi:unnamed protein product [Euphydryas editha]|uniref:Uncharacterized protein n=1 Tax=Euphydryas editha TaxID=104508 RepID=A0AAU9TVU5_EUPED|nr:unnamed protein product [Euphydryas editha]